MLNPLVHYSSFDLTITHFNIFITNSQFIKKNLANIKYKTLKIYYSCPKNDKVIVHNLDMEFAWPLLSKFWAMDP